MKPLLMKAIPALLFALAVATAQTPAECRQTISTDSKAIANDLSAIAAQAKAQGIGDAIEQFASDLETIIPTLNPPGQDAVQKFASDLVAATSATGPGGTAITPSERLKLTNDWTILITSTGATPDQIALISNDLVNALSTLKGISTAQLQTDLNVLRTDLTSCSSLRPLK